MLYTSRTGEQGKISIQSSIFHKSESIMHFRPKIFKRNYIYCVILVILLLLAICCIFHSSFSFTFVTIIFLSSLILMFSLGLYMSKTIDSILEAKKLSEERLQIISEHLPEFLWMKDRNGVFLMTNKAYAVSCGKKTSYEMIGCCDQDFYSEEVSMKFRLDDEAIMKERKGRISEEILYDQGIKKYFEVFKTPILNDSGEVTGIVGSARDIAQRKKAEGDKETLLAELEGKNKEMESLIYVASHDLRSPLVNLQGFSQLLDKAFKKIQSNLPMDNLPEVSKWIIKENLEEKIPGFLKFILASTAKMDALISGLLKVSRTGRDPLNLEQISMNKLIKNVIFAMTYQIEKNNSEIIVGDLPECSGDSGQLNQVFTNILENALNYRDPEKKLKIKISGTREENLSHYQIEDNGIGIEKDSQLRIWEIFLRLDPKGAIPGEGLGLTIAKRIIERHGGKIWVESQPETGSIFHVLLKATEGAHSHV